MTEELLFDAPKPVLAATTEGRWYPVNRVFCLGRNYLDHVREMGSAVDVDALPFFTKWAEAVVPSGADVPYPPATDAWHHEVELVAALGAPVDVGAGEAAALDAVWGYAVGVDMTRRDLQSISKASGQPWDWAKNGPGAAPMGAIRPAAEIGHPTEGAISLSIDGEPKQAGDLDQMMWGVGRIIAYIARFYVLAPGDLIFTGTPAGVGPVRRGQTVEAQIAGLPSLSFKVV